MSNEMPCLDHGKVGTGKGYAQKSRNNRMRYMHRLAYADAHGLDELAMSGVVMHSCDNPRCVEPTHLSLGTHKSNTDDMMGKGRHIPPRVLTPAQVAEFRSGYIPQSRTHGQAAYSRKFGVDSSTLSCIHRNVTWSNV